MAKPTAAWGIDIGQCALKALRLELEDGQATATAFDYIEHAKILSQPDADADQLTREALEKFLSRNALGNDIVAIGVPGQSGLARFVKLPPVEPSKIPDIVRFEAKQQIPFPLDEVVWDFQKISGGEVIDKFAMETEIGLFAMKKEVISKHMGQFNQAGVEVNIVQMAPLALCNYATYELLGKGGPNPVEVPADDDTPRGKKRCVVVLDVGTDATNLIITDAGKIIWQRPLPLGGNHFTRSLVKEMKLTFPKAEHLKRNAAKSPDLATILKALRPVLTDFVGEVQRSLGYFTNTHRDAHVAMLVGLGSAFRLPGLQKYMSEKLSLEVKRPSTVDRLAGEGVKSDPVFMDNLLTFPVAYGLALQGLNELSERKDYGRINTNLLPPQIKVDRLIRSKKPYAAAAAAALLFGTGVLAVGYGAQYSSVTDATLEKSMNTAKAQVSAAGSQTTEKGRSEQEIKDTASTVKSIIKGNDNRMDMLRLNETFLATLPRPGAKGNFDTSQTEKYAVQDPAPRALTKFEERIRNGVTESQANDDDLSDALARVQIESVYMQYTDNVKGFLDKAAEVIQKEQSRPIAVTMSEAERETKEVPGVVPATQGLFPKGPEGGGYVVQVSGYTNYANVAMVKDVVIANFRKAMAYADQNAMLLVDKQGRVVEYPATIATDAELKAFAEKNGLKLERKMKYYLPGVADPLQGRLGWVFLLNDDTIENPQPKSFKIITQDYITPYLPVAGGAVADGTGTVPPVTAPVDAAATSTAAPSTGWTPFTTPGTATITGSGTDTTAVVPAAPGAPVPKVEKKRVRHEFVICFIWKDGGAPVTGAAATPAAVPSAAPANTGGR